MFLVVLFLRNKLDVHDDLPVKLARKREKGNEKRVRCSE